MVYRSVLLLPRFFAWRADPPRIRSGSSGTKRQQRACGPLWSSRQRRLQPLVAAAGRAALAVLFAAAPLCAQGEDPAALLKKADDAAVAAMHARADALAELKQYARALALRQEIVGEFAPGDEKALTALGFVNDGNGWHRDANKIVLDRDLKADAKVKKLDADWERAQKDLARNYEKAATALSGAGQQQQAIAAWRRLLP